MNIPEDLFFDLLVNAQKALNVWSDNHALSHMNWGNSFLSARDIRELNEVPLDLSRCIEKCKKYILAEQEK